MEAWVMARSFNGTSDFIDLGAGAASNLAVAANSPVAISFWFLYTTFTGDSRPFSMGFTTSLSIVPYFTRYDNAGHMTIGRFQTAGGQVEALAAVPSANVWHSFYGDYDGAHWNILIDGTTSGQTTSAFGPAGGGTVDPLIGADSNNGTAQSFWPGRLADMAIWSTNLTALEQNALSKGARPFTVRPKSLLSYWPLGGLQSPEPDLSGVNKNNGTLTGTNPAFGPPIAQFTPRWPQFFPSMMSPSPFVLMPQIVT
jgi:hypothetical protein